MRFPLFFGLLLALAPSAHAQLLPSVDLGVSGGPTFGSVGGVAGASLDNSTGYHVGVHADVSAVFLSFRTGLYYLRAGDVQQGQDRVSASFITIPLDLKVQTPTPLVQAYALAGPEVRFPLGTSGALVDTRAVNVAVNVGAGASFRLPVVGPSAFAELRYAYDVTGFAEAASVVTSDNTYRLNVFMVRVGVGL